MRDKRVHDNDKLRSWLRTWSFQYLNKYLRRSSVDQQAGWCVDNHVIETVGFIGRYLYLLSKFVGGSYHSPSCRDIGLCSRHQRTRIKLVRALQSTIELNCCTTNPLVMFYKKDLQFVRVAEFGPNRVSLTDARAPANQASTSAGTRVLWQLIRQSAWMTNVPSTVVIALE